VLDVWGVIQNLRQKIEALQLAEDRENRERGERLRAGRGLRGERMVTAAGTPA
jgi:hypothetical protein